MFYKFLGLLGLVGLFEWGTVFAVPPFAAFPFAFAFVVTGLVGAFGVLTALALSVVTGAFQFGQAFLLVFGLDDV